MLQDKYDGVRKIIQTKLYDEWNDTKIKFSNFPLDTDPTESWISLHIVFGDEAHSSISNRNAVYRGAGLFQIDICVPINIGTGTLNVLATKLHDIFISYKTDSFRVKSASYTEGFIENDIWYKGVLTFYFNWDYLV